LSSFEKILKNDGYYSKGLDKKIMLSVDETFFENLQKEIITGSYIPKATRRVYIRKKDGRKRPLGISCSVDKVVQLSMKEHLEAIFEPIFDVSSHGFRPDKSCHTAINEVKLKFNGVN
jgi:retron-type reverse transcriptase